MTFLTKSEPVGSDTLDSPPEDAPVRPVEVWDATGQEWPAGLDRWLDNAWCDCGSTMGGSDRHRLILYPGDDQIGAGVLACDGDPLPRIWSVEVDLNGIYGFHRGSEGQWGMTRPEAEARAVELRRHYRNVRVRRTWVDDPSNTSTTSRVDRRRPAWSQDPARSMAANVGGAL